MGYVVAIAVSIPLAVALVNSRLLSRTLYPILVIVQSTPIVAVAPIIVVTLGASDLPRVVITFLITFFPIVVSTVTGLMATPEELIELSRSLRAGRTREMLHIRLPFAVPYIFSALKISITLAIIGAVVAEFVAAEHGLGFFIMFSTSFFRDSASVRRARGAGGVEPHAVQTLHAGAALVRAVVAAEIGKMKAPMTSVRSARRFGRRLSDDLAAGEFGAGVGRKPDEDQGRGRGEDADGEESRRKVIGVHGAAVLEPYHDLDDQGADGDAGRERQLLRPWRRASWRGSSSAVRSRHRRWC